MTDVSETTIPAGPECHAGFRVSGAHLDLDAITQTLGIKPTHVHGPGDLNILGEPYPDFMWSVDSPLRREEDLGAHLDWLGTTLSPQISYLRTLKNTADLSIVCNYLTSDTDQGGFTLTPRNLSFALELDIRVEFHLLFI